MREDTGRDRAGTAARGGAGAPIPDAATQLDASDLLLLHRTSSAILRGLDGPAVARAMTDAIEEIFGHRRAAAVIVLEPDGPRVLAHTRYGLDGEPLRPGTEDRVTALLRTPDADGIIDWVMKHETAVRLGDARRDPRYLEHDRRVRAELCVPIRGPNGTVGVINVESARENAFSARDETLLSVVANQLSAALDNARLYQEVSRELAERRAMDRALRQSERRFRKMLERGGELVALLDRLGKVRYASESVRHVLGCDVEAFTRAGLCAFAADEDDSRLNEAFASVLDDLDSSQTVEFPARHGDGRRIRLEVQLRNLLDDADVAAVVVVASDVTERRAAEQEQRLHSAVVESTRDGIVVTGPDGRVLSVNRAFADITGFPESEILGQPLDRLSPREGEHQAPMGERLEQTGHWQGEVPVLRNDGTTASTWLTLNTVFDDARRPRHRVGIYTDISQLKASQAETEWLANYDPLTALPNRVLITAGLERALARAERNGLRVAVLYIDLDRFKNVNDSFGHAAGDELLRAAARRLQDRVRRGDSIGRLGGDEFLVILESMHEPEDAARLARALLERLDREVDIGEGRLVHAGASIGVSVFPDDGRDAGELIRNADAAMYLAKDHGRHTYRFYSRALTVDAQDRLDLEMRLRTAVEARALTLAYQPIFSMDGTRLLGAEALLRWTPPGGAPVSPERFVPIAEESGLIIPLGAWVLDEACRQLRHWLDAGLDPGVLAVNVSHRQLERGDLEPAVRAAIGAHRIDPARLELEITESGIMRRARRVEPQLEALKALGVRLAIDDFGTGYSSLAHLKRFPVDKLKIDRSFVRDIPGDGADLQIATAVISMARSLGLEALAEGVETEAQRAILAERGCDAFQGFLVSPALGAAEFEAGFLRLSSGSPGSS